MGRSRHGRRVPAPPKLLREVPRAPATASPEPAGPRERERLQRFRRRAGERGVNPLVYRLARLVLVPFFRLYFRLRGVGMEHLPRSGPLLLAANHRSFLDPFVIGAMARRPIYYMAKRELFASRPQAWLLNALGAFPVDRGAGDEQALATARAILARGDCVVIFPEGTRVRRGPLGAPRRGIGRLALESGARVVPVAVIGTENVRRGWRVRPRRVRIRCGAPLAFPTAHEPSPALAAGVTDRIWACISLQWEWLGGDSSALRHSTVAREGERREARAA
jgi:glycerol-3-phosphate dehydrogenase (NAD(P)+)